MSDPKKTPEDMAGEIYRRGSNLSASEMSELVSRVMKEHGYDPNDKKLRVEIGKIYRRIR